MQVCHIELYKKARTGNEVAYITLLWGSVVLLLDEIQDMDKLTTPIRRRSRRLSAARIDKSPLGSNRSVPTGEDVERGTQPVDAGHDSEKFLENFIKAKSALLPQILPASVLNRKRAREESANLVSSTESFNESPNLSADALWQLYLASLPSDFFSSREAQLISTAECVQSGSAGATYKALSLDHTVLPDLRTFYNNQVQPQIVRSQGIPTYQQLKLCLGQLARFACAARFCRPSDYSTAGGLFHLSTNEKLHRAFIMGLQSRCAASTVACKAAKLLKWASFSACFYSKEGNQPASSMCSLTAQFLRGTAASEKREARRCARTGKRLISRIETQNMILLSDFERAQKRALAALEGLVSTLTAAFKRHKAVVLSDRENVAYDILGEKDGLLLRKWCLNFLCAVVLCGAGQRAQVYSELSLTAFGVNTNGTVVDTIAEVESCAKSAGHFFLQSKFEKRLRSTRMPYIRVPVGLLHIYLFHIQYARPAVLRRNGMANTDDIVLPGEEVLLLNTESGFPLEPKQISSSVKRFFKNMDGELKNVTPLVLRRSYATIMLHKYLKGEICSGKTKAQFLEYLAERLNTSVEQLDDAYCADEDVQQAVSRIFQDE